MQGEGGVFQHGPREIPGGPWGLGSRPKQTMFFQSVSGGSWGALGVVLVLWDGPWVGPGKSKCCYFVDNTDVLEMQRFSLIFC